MPCSLPARSGASTARASHSAASTSASSAPVSVSTRIEVAVAHACASGPPSRHSGETWMAAGTLPEAPDMRPVGHERDLEAAVEQHAERRGELVQLRHAVRARALPLDHRDEVAVELAGLEGRRRAPSATRTRSPAPRSTRWSGLTAAILATERPRLPVHEPQARRRRGRGASAEATMVASSERSGAGAPASEPRAAPPVARCPRRPTRRSRAPRCSAGGPPPATVLTPSCTSFASRSSRITSAMPPAAWNWLTSAWPDG